MVFTTVLLSGSTLLLMHRLSKSARKYEYKVEFTPIAHEFYWYGSCGHFRLKPYEYLNDQHVYCYHFLECDSCLMKNRIINCEKRIVVEAN